MCWTAGVDLVPRVVSETLTYEQGGFLIFKKKKKKDPGKRALQSISKNVVNFPRPELKMGHQK